MFCNKPTELNVRMCDTSNPRAVPFSPDDFSIYEGLRSMV